MTKAMEVEARKMRRDIASEKEKEVAAMLVDKKLQLVFKFFLVLVILGKRSNVYRIMNLILYKNEILFNLNLYMFFLMAAKLLIIPGF